MKRDLAIVAALVIATLTVYGQTLGFEFLDYDDDGYVTRSTLVNSGISFESVRSAFVQRSAYWIPVTAMSYMLESTLYGIEPGVFHATNVALHALDVVLLFVLLRMLTGAVWPSAIVAALFALHPMRVESVAWVSTRKDVLSAAFGLLALIAYTRYAKRGSLRAYGAAFAFLILALLSKATWVSLPFLFLLLDFWPLRRFGPTAPEDEAFPIAAARRTGILRLVAEKLPFAAVVVAMVVVTSEVQRPSRIPWGRLPIGERFVHALVAYAWYIGKTLWPSGLSPHYPHPYLVGGGVPWTDAQIALAALLIAGLTILSLRFARYGYPLVGWLWYLGTFAPVIGLFQHGNQGMADRYTHLPHIGLFIAAVFSGWELLVPRLRTHALRRAAAAAVMTLLFAFGSAAFVQTSVWRDTETLFTHAMRVMPRDAVIQRAVANCHLEAGRFDEALRHAKTALNLRPHFLSARKVLTLAFQRRAALDPAAPDPDFLFDGVESDAFVHEEMAEIAYDRGDRDGALAHARAALAVNPDSIRALWQLGMLLRERGDHSGASDAFRRIVALVPDSTDARDALTSAERAREAPSRADQRNIDPR